MDAIFVINPDKPVNFANATVLDGECPSVCVTYAGCFPGISGLDEPEFEFSPCNSSCYGEVEIDVSGEPKRSTAFTFQCVTVCDNGTGTPRPALLYHDGDKFSLVEMDGETAVTNATICKIDSQGNFDYEVVTVCNDQGEPRSAIMVFNTLDGTHKLFETDGVTPVTDPLCTDPEDSESFTLGVC